MKPVLPYAIGTQEIKVANARLNMAIVRSAEGGYQWSELFGLHVMGESASRYSIFVFPRSWLFPSQPTPSILNSNTPWWVFPGCDRSIQKETSVPGPFRLLFFPRGGGYICAKVPFARSEISNAWRAGGFLGSPLPACFHYRPAPKSLF
jgi:hypothetical protein